MKPEQTLQLTQQRTAVLSAVQEACAHVDAAQVFEAVRLKIPRISLGTVYRALGALRDAGMIHEIDTGTGPALYDGNLMPHQHITCRRCGAVADLKLEVPVEVLSEAAKSSGFVNVENSRVDFHGICKTCAN